MSSSPAPVLLFNGEQKSSSTPLFTSHNRAFRYGDGVFESMRVAGGKLAFSARHLKRLMAGVNLLQLRLPDNFVSKSLDDWCMELCRLNELTGGARARLSVFRNDGGYYNPLTNEASWLLELWPYETEAYSLNDKGLAIELYQDIRKPVNKLSGIKSSNSELYVLAALYAKSMNVDDSVLINQSGNVIEATGSNLFAVKNGVLYTSPVSEGCVAGVMRSVIMDIAQENRIAVYEVPLPLSVLLNSDEIFLCNAVRGIQWVGTYRAKRYSNAMAKKLMELINKKAMPGTV
ncbi:MAG TPA: aminotransferase class IV [Bacteroidia bacterium]|nr:aminotransferase class IV [Bacteroidia bacterium]